METNPSYSPARDAARLTGRHGQVICCRDEGRKLNLSIGQIFITKKLYLCIIVKKPPSVLSIFFSAQLIFLYMHLWSCEFQKAKFCVCQALHLFMCEKSVCHCLQRGRFSQFSVIGLTVSLCRVLIVVLFFCTPPPSEEHFC